MTRHVLSRSMLSAHHRRAVRRVVVSAEDGGGPLANFPQGFLTTEELAELLHVDPSSVRRWRTAEPLQGPPFIQVSDRVTLYSASDVKAWLMSRRTVPGGAK